MGLQFKKAERRQAKLKLLIAGPSGSGKTMSALRLAKGIGGKVAVIDTENGSASLYGDRHEFDTLLLEPPFTAAKYVEAISAAEQAGYDIIVVDSFSHAWAGEGGALDQKSARDARGGSQFANWKEPKQEYARVKNAILHSSAHVICTVRSKQAYLQGEDSGRVKIQRAGMDPIAEPGIEYEFSVMFDVAIDHNAIASKDRTSLFDKQTFLITEETGKALMAWLASAKPAEQKPAPAPVQPLPPAATSSAQFGICSLPGCGGHLKLSSSKKVYYCPNFQNTALGEHTRVPAEKIQEYVAHQQGRAEPEQEPMFDDVGAAG